MTTEPSTTPTSSPLPTLPLSAEVIVSIRAVVDDEDLWNTEREDYEKQDPSDRHGHLFEHLRRIDRFLRQLSPPDHTHAVGVEPAGPSLPVVRSPQHCPDEERLAEATMITVAGISYERVANLHTLSPGEWLRFTPSSGDTGTTTQHLTVIGPHGQHGVMCRRHGRALMPAEQHIVLTKPVIELGQVHRAMTQPQHGIPGTWCDSYDSNGDNCGRSLHHRGICRH
ncbi:hypothetical protein ACWECC_17270 [Streptomyces microflavus]